MSIRKRVAAAAAALTAAPTAPAPQERPSASARHDDWSKKAGYVGGDRDRRATRTWQPRPGSPDADTLPDLVTLRARSRDMARNVMVAGGAIATVTGNVVGEGLTPKPAIDRELLGLDEDAAMTWQRQAEREFDLFAAACDYAGVTHFADLQGLVFRAMLESGDVAVVRRFAPRAGEPYGLKLQTIEADRISNPRWAGDSETLRGGVELSRVGRPIAYHVASRHPGDRFVTATTTEWRRLPRIGRDGDLLVLHLFQPLRPGQTRGVPYLAPVIEGLKQLGDYQDAEVTAAVNAAMIFGFIKAPAPLDDEGRPIVGEHAAGDAADEIRLENGALVNLLPGEEADMKTPGRPNSEFEQFTLAVLRFVGVALELPFELLVKHFTASYSASRAALEMGWQMFRRRRTWLARSFCQPVWQWWLTEAVASGRIEAPGFFDDPAIRAAWSGCQWIGPARPNLDPMKEASADALDVENGFKTIEQVVTERTGGRWDRKHEQRVREATARREAGLEAEDPQSASVRGVSVDGDGAVDESEDLEASNEIARQRGVGICAPQSKAHA